MYYYFEDKSGLEPDEGQCRAGASFDNETRIGRLVDCRNELAEDGGAAHEKFYPVYKALAHLLGSQSQLVLAKVDARANDFVHPMERVDRPVT